MNSSGVAQRQLDHFAQLLDGVADAADIVVIDRGSPAVRLLEFGAQLDLGVLVDVDDALGAGRNHRQADLRQRIGGGVEQPAHLRRHVMHRLLPGGGDQIAGDQRLAEEIALQRLRGTLQPHFAHRRGENDAGGGTRLRGGDGDMLAGADFGIAALEPVEAHHLERLVLLVSRHGDRRGGALPGDLEHIALGHAERLEGAARQPGDALSAFLLPCRRDLQLDRLVRYRRLRIGHRPLSCSVRARREMGSRGPLVK